MCRCRRPRAPVAPHSAEPVAPPRAAAAPPPRARPWLEYVGATALTVVGPASGLRYRFDRPGARLAVDPRDHVALLAVPHLRPHGAF